MVDRAGRLTNPTDHQIWLDLLISLGRLPHKLEVVLALLPNLSQRQIKDSQGTKIQHQVRLTESDILKLVDDYRTGLTVMHLAQRYGIHRTTVMGHLRRKGVPKQGRKLTREQIAQAKYIRKMGMSYEKIGEVFGVDGETIRVRLANQ